MEARKAANTPGVSWEQYCKDNGMEDKPYPGTLKKEPVKVQTVRKKPCALTEVRTGVNSAHAVLNNSLHLDMTGVTQLRDVFKKRYGCSPEDYLKEHEEVTTGNTIHRNLMAATWERMPAPATPPIYSNKTIMKETKKYLQIY